MTAINGRHEDAEGLRSKGDLQWYGAGPTPPGDDSSHAT
jgi:hypothetical protein